MKKAIALILAAVSLMLASCGKGASVSYREIRNRLEPATAFASDGKYKSYTETLTYYDENGNDGYSYSVCIEPASDNAYGYNIIQKDSEYSVYACDGKVFAENDGKLYSVILISETYYEYIESYLTCSHDFDGLSYHQLYSKKSDDGVITVAYEAKMTIEVAAKYSSMGFEIGDSLLATYEIYGDYITDEISYTLKKANGTEKPLLRREFSYSEKASGGFSSLPEDDTAKVTVIFNYGKDDESKSVFTAQKNCYLGISGGNINASFFIDSELTVPFSPGKVFISGDLTLYAVYN